jgi:ABC-2 type transport system ATP-binding protein
MEQKRAGSDADSDADSREKAERGVTEALIDLDHVEVRYGDRVALSNVKLRLEKGRIGLVGPSGAGKSSLLKALLGVVVPSKGSVRVLGQEVVKDPQSIRARIGYMPEGDQVLADLSALDYTRLAAELCGIPSAEATARAHEILGYVGLDEVRYRVLSGFSTGQRQRARLAQALVSAPELLLLDEPTSGLDPAGRAEMLALIEDIPRRSGASVLLSTHILPDVERTCDQVVVLAQGELRYAGPLGPLLEAESRRYTVRVKQNAEALKTLLRHAGCEVELSGETLSVRVPPDHDAQFLLRTCVNGGFQVRHLAPLALTLDQAFRKAVTSESWDPAAAQPSAPRASP